MERPTWVTKPTVRRPDGLSWELKRTEPINEIILNQAVHYTRDGLALDFYGRFRNIQTMKKFVERIRTEEGLIEPR